MQLRLCVILLAFIGVFVTSVPSSRSSPIGAEEVLQEALARARDIKDQRLQQLALREVIHTAGRVGNMQVLLQLVDEAAEEQQFEPAIALVDAIPTVEGKIYALTTLADMSKRSDAVVLLRRADALLRRVRGSEARDDAITDLAVSMAKAAQFSRAVELAARVQGNFARLSLFNTLLQEAKEQPLRREDRPALRRLAQLLRATQVTWEDAELKEVFRDRHLVLAGVALALADDIEGVRQLMLQVRDKQWRREVLRGILGELMVTEIDHDVPVTEYPSLHWLNGGTISERLPTDRHYALIQKLLGQFGDADLKRWVTQQLADVLPEKELQEPTSQTVQLLCGLAEGISSR